jgi:hypothetical protein
LPPARFYKRSTALHGFSRHSMLPTKGGNH